MHSRFGIAILLSVMAVLPGQSSSMAIGTNSGSVGSGQTCPKIVRNCTATLWKGDRSPNLTLSELCKVADGAKSCIGEVCLATLTSGKDAMLVHIYDYTCEPSRAAVMERMINSVCVKDHSIIEEIGESCANAAAAEFQELLSSTDASSMDDLMTGSECTIMVSATRCIIRRVGEKCGKYMIPVLGDLLKIVIRYSAYPYMHCFAPQPNTNVHSVVKRAATAFLKHIVKKK